MRNTALQFLAGIAWACGLLFLALVAFPAFAAEATGVVESAPLVDSVAVWTADVLILGIFAVAAVAVAILKQKTGIDLSKGLMEIEAKHREALHSGIYSAVASLANKTGVGNLKLNVGSEDIAAIIRHLRDSVPDALEALTPSDAVITSIAQAKAIELAAKIGLGTATASSTS